MAGKEYDPTNKEGRGRERRKGLPSESHESSQQKTGSEDTRGDLLMGRSTLKERAAKKQKKEKDTPQASPSQIQEQARPKSVFLESVFQRAVFSAENQILRIENEQLRAENEELINREERRKEKDRQRKAKKRQENRDEYNTYMRELYASKKKQTESSS